MKPMSLNMAKMKKVAGDKNSSTFLHDDGHQIKIAHAALPALQRKQLEKLPIKMAEGGAMGDLATSLQKSFGAPSPTPAPTPTRDQQYEQTREQNTANMNQGIQSYKEGGLVSNNPKLQQSKVRNPVSPKQAVLKRYAEAGPVSNSKSDEDADIASLQQQQSPAGQYANTPVNAGNVTPPGGPNPNVLNPNGLVNATGAAQLENKGIQTQQAADTGVAQGSVENQNAYIKAQGQVLQKQDQYTNELRGQADNFRDYNNANPIDNNHWAESKSTGQKIAIATGLLLGGFGQGVTGQGGNSTLDFINNQISRDIDAQKARADQQKNIWGAYKDLYQNETIANHMTRAALDDIHSANTAKIAAQMGTVQAQATAQKLQGAYAMDKEENIRKAGWNAVMQTPMGGAQQMPGQQGVSNAPAPSTEQVPNVPYIGGNGQMIGKPGTTAMPATPDQSNAFKPDKILVPGALQMAGASGDPEMMNEAVAANQAEKFLNGVKGDGVGGIHDLYQRLYAESGSGKFGAGVGGATQRSGSGIMGGLGAAIGEAAGKSPTAAGIGALLGSKVKIPEITQAQKEYALNRQKVKQEVASSLHGVLSVNDIDSFIDPYIPGFMDSPELVAKKEAGLRDTIKKALVTGHLQSKNQLVE